MFSHVQPTTAEGVATSLRRLMEPCSTLYDHSLQCCDKSAEDDECGGELRVVTGNAIECLALLTPRDTFSIGQSLTHCPPD